MADTSKKNQINLETLTKADVDKMDAADVTRLKNTLVSSSMVELKDRHEDEFEEIVSGKFEKYGLTRVNRKQAAKAKAKKDMEAILAQYPDLAPAAK